MPKMSEQSKLSISHGHFSSCSHFLIQEAVLRATPYLADIVKLQNALYNEFHHRIGLKVAKEKTIGEFISESMTTLEYYMQENIMWCCLF